MASLEQIPGDLDITVVQGDDYNLQLSVDENYSGYTFVTTIHPIHGSTLSATTTLSAGSAVSTIQISFTATTTSSLDVTTDEGSHTWRLVGDDVSGLTRTYVSGDLTVLTTK